MGNVLAPYSFNLQGGYPQGTEPETYGTVEVVLGLRNFYVSKTGSDSNTGLGTGDGEAFLTILKASQAAIIPGDVVNIMAGTWSEDSGSLWFSTEATIAPQAEGTLANPIIFRAHVGDEGSVIIDSLDTRVGFFIGSNNYIHILNLKFLNHATVGIVNQNVGPEQRYYSNVIDSQICVGCVIEGNYISETDGAAGLNIASIRCDNSVDMVIRNNYCGVLRQDGVIAVSDATSSVQGYHVKNILIENNHFDGGWQGVLWKDHWLEDNDDAIVEAEVRNNLIECGGIGIIEITGNTEPRGSTWNHHNVVIAGRAGYQHNSIAATAGLPGGYAQLENNTFVVTNDTGGNTTAVQTDVGTLLTMTGNIVLGGKSASLGTVATGDRTDLMTLKDLDYNVHDDGTVGLGITKFDIAKNSTYPDFITGLVNWQATLISDNPILSSDNPDPNSITSNSTVLFTDFAGGDYTNKVGSPAIGLLLDGSNAGAYQLGTEVIGRTGGGAT